VPCFNATTGDFTLPSNDDVDDENDSSDDSSESSPAASSPSASSGSGGGLSGGAIAGIVVGVLAGVGLLGGAAFFIWRLRNQRERLRAQEASVRAVKWDQTGRASTTPSEQGGDVALRDMAGRA
jgi:predicted lipid-binding transport protein (Tim44 family)